MRKLTKDERVVISMVLLLVLMVGLVVYYLFSLSIEADVFIDCMDRINDFWHCLNR